jgi:hypothetical protein
VGGGGVVVGVGEVGRVGVEEFLTVSELKALFCTGTSAIPTTRTKGTKRNERAICWSNSKGKQTLND